MNFSILISFPDEESKEELDEDDSVPVKDNDTDRLSYLFPISYLSILFN